MTEVPAEIRYTNQVPLPYYIEVRLQLWAFIYSNPVAGMLAKLYDETH
jgi:hypothetical protein